FDYLSLLVTLSIVGVLVYGGFIAMRAISNAVQSTKEALKTKGVDVSKHGVSVKTNKRYDREEYLDDTQRGFIRAVKASSAGRQADQERSNAQLEKNGSFQDKQNGHHLHIRKNHVVEK
ncbi:hypothetical protein BD414DRAFT_423166, partial [Trametes punicea]